MVVNCYLHVLVWRENGDSALLVDNSDNDSDFCVCFGALTSATKRLVYALDTYTLKGAVAIFVLLLGSH